MGSSHIVKYLNIAFIILNKMQSPILIQNKNIASICNFVNERFQQLHEAIEQERKFTLIEIGFSLFFSKEEAKKIVEGVHDIKDKLWAKAMKKAEGNIEKSFTFYGKV